MDNSNSPSEYGDGYLQTDPISGLNNLEGRIFDEIVKLREKNIQLMRQLNDEVKNFNDLQVEYKRVLA